VDLILITNNTLEFSRIDGLRIEDWKEKKRRVNPRDSLDRSPSVIDIGRVDKNPAEGRDKTLRKVVPKLSVGS
jgi:hypothetical protein